MTGVPRADDPDAWKLGYQTRQFGVSGPSQQETGSAYNAMANPPTSMTTALAVVPDTTHHEPTE